jgi:diaminopimelate epimerase
MEISFFKYQGTGNDFVMIDNRNGGLSLGRGQVAFLCDRRFGVGADGLILLEEDSESDFRMVYFNSDGGESTFCGNGGRCAVAFARMLNPGMGRSIRFRARDGFHLAEAAEDRISLAMNLVAPVMPVPGLAGVFDVHTGSPHRVLVYSEKADSDTVFRKGREVREAHSAEGINVNFMTLLGENRIFLRTYERGVEAETLSCGTGVTAAALVAAGMGCSSPVSVETPGGRLEVRFWRDAEGSLHDIWLEGPAVRVFEGKIRLVG